MQSRPAPTVSVSVGPNLYKQTQPYQYITAIPDSTGGAPNTFNTHYVFGGLSQTELSAAIRLNWTYSPTLSLQLYAQPLISAGRYDYSREPARPRSASFIRYGRDNGSTIAYVDSTNSYTVDPDGRGPAQPMSFGNQSFNFKSLRGNAVLRWEYMPGSTLYFVWTQSRSAADDNGDFRLGPSMRGMLRAPAENIFMIKATYWWNPRLETFGRWSGGRGHEVVQWPVPLVAPEPRCRGDRTMDKVERVGHRLLERATEREPGGDRRRERAACSVGRRRVDALVREAAC